MLTVNITKHFKDSCIVFEVKRTMFNSDSSFKGIAYSLGFSDITSLVMFFKKHTG